MGQVIDLDAWRPRGSAVLVPPRTDTAGWLAFPSLPSWAPSSCPRSPCGETTSRRAPAVARPAEPRGSARSRHVATGRSRPRRAGAPPVEAEPQGPPRRPRQRGRPLQHGGRAGSASQRVRRARHGVAQDRCSCGTTVVLAFFGFERYRSASASAACSSNSKPCWRSATA